jgi:hypothetical protein
VVLTDPVVVDVVVVDFEVELVIDVVVEVGPAETDTEVDPGGV